MKKIILRRCAANDADGVCGYNGGDAFDTDSQHVYSLQIYYTKIDPFESLLLYQRFRSFFSIHFSHFVMIMVCTCEKGDAKCESVSK